MPITVQSPVVNQNFGVGFVIHASTDFIGPLQPGSFWRITLQNPPPLEASFGTQDFMTSSSSLIRILGKDDTTGFYQAVVGQTGLQHGQPAQVSVAIHNPDQTIFQEQKVLVVHDMVTPMPWLVTQPLQVGASSGDHALIQEILDSVKGNLPTTEGATAQVAKTVFDLLSKPPQVLLCKREGFPVNGVQTLTRTGVLGPVSAYGASLDFSILPDRTGLTVGVNDIAFSRLAQVMLIRTNACGDEYVAELHDIRERHHDLFWSDPLTLKRIEISVLAGVTCGWNWYGLVGL